MTSREQPLKDIYGDLTDAGWRALRARVVAAAGAGTGLNGQDVIELHSLLSKLESNIDVRVMALGYNFIVNDDGTVQGLTAGDHNYEDARLKLDMSGWHAIDDSIDPEKIGNVDWMRHWRWVTKVRPADYEIVVTKTPGGAMSYDWLEPGRHRDKGVGERSYFAENLGRAQFWMPREEFERLAPPWAKAQVLPLQSKPVATPTEGKSDV